MHSLRVIVAAGVVALTTVAGATGCEPPKCKTSLHKYDHKTGPITWFTLYNDMRFCYDGSNATSIEWTDNRTSSPTRPHSRGNVSTVKLIEPFDGGKHRRARNISRHTINCAQVIGGFDVEMRQWGYGSGDVIKSRSSISSATDC